jgi:hypothetical protein
MLEMAKGMALGSMFVLLVVVVLLLPIVLRFINRLFMPHYAISGFQDIAGSMNGVSNIPAIGSTSKLPTWRPDANTDYLCRSPNEDGNPCPEGMFCDGTTQSCIPVYTGGSVPSTGYFA